MVKVCWLIAHEKLEFDPLEPKLSEAVTHNNVDLFLSTYDSIKYQYDIENLLYYDIVIPHGPIQFFKQLEKEIPARLYTFGFNKYTDFSYYTSMISDLPFLNHDYVLLPYQQIYRYWSKKEDSLFIRPNSGFKAFTGFTIPCGYLGHKDSKDILEQNQKLQHIYPSELCVVSSKKDIKAEFRFVICNNRVIASSQYCWDNVKDVRIDVPPKALELAQKVADYKWQLDLVYVVDIAIDLYDNPSIIEFNSFSSSGLYNCDRDAIVKQVTKASIEEYHS